MWLWLFASCVNKVNDFWLYHIIRICRDVAKIRYNNNNNNNSHIATYKHELFEDAVHWKPEEHVMVETARRISYNNSRC